MALRILVKAIKAFGILQVIAAVALPATEASTTPPDDTRKTPSWEELDSRPLPPWYDAAKFGIFIHWGVFSVPSFTSEWFWDYWHDNYNTDGSEARFVARTERPGFSYQEYAPRFTADLYNATEWSDIFADSGAQYVVLTSKHHEGYCMWNSTKIPATWNWNVMDVGPHRDVLGELASAVKAARSPHTSKNLKFGVYHSMCV
jgi:alpha-L-fucosidase